MKKVILIIGVLLPLICKSKIPERFSDDFKFLLYVIGDSDGILSLELDSISIIKDDIFKSIPEDFDPSEEEIIDPLIPIGILYYYDRDKNMYILEGGGTQQSFYKESAKPILGKRIKIFLTYNGRKYKYIAQPNKKDGKEFSINYDVDPSKLNQRILQMVM